VFAIGDFAARTIGAIAKSLSIDARIHARRATL
jgi:hypothetical protein